MITSQDGEFSILDCEDLFVCTDACLYPLMCVYLQTAFTQSKAPANSFPAALGPSLSCTEGAKHVYYHIGYATVHVG